MPRVLCIIIGVLTILTVSCSGPSNPDIDIDSSTAYIKSETIDPRTPDLSNTLLYDAPPEGITEVDDEFSLDISAGKNHGTSIQKQCTLSGGEFVDAGWTGQDTGDNHCNSCFCNENGVLGCTKMACLASSDTDALLLPDLPDIPLDLGVIGGLDDALNQMSEALPEGSIPEGALDMVGEILDNGEGLSPDVLMQDPCVQMPVNARPMCYMMLQRAQMMGQSGVAHGNLGQDDTPPNLYNLLVDEFIQYDPTTSMMGPFKFSKSFFNGPFPTVFDEFGRVHDAGRSTEYENPTFEYRFPAATKLISPVSGLVDDISWQPTDTYKQDDWELIIKPSRFSAWRVSIDHVLSLSCDIGSKEVCDEPLIVNGEAVKVGMQINAGDKIGYAGNLVDNTNSGMVGRTEITVGRFASEGVFESYCPVMYLDDSVKQNFRDSISALMDTYEEWSGDRDLYDQSAMVEPGCLYEQINDVGNKTTVVK